MDFELTDEQRAYCQTISRFGAEALRDDTLVDRDAAHQFSHSAWKRCAEVGLTGLIAPETDGGQGADAMMAVLALEALGAACLDNGLLFSLNAHLWSCVHPLVVFGTDSQRRRYLPGLCDGSVIGVQAMTEPSSGSDAYAMGTSAIREGDVYVVNGSKTYITNAPVAGLFLVFAQSDSAAGSLGTTALIVERDTPGLEIGPPFHKMGLRTSPMSELHLEDCRVPVAQRLGGEGGGMAVFTSSIDWERSFILATALGTMQRQLDAAVQFAREREQFGQPIGSFQAVAHRLVDVACQLEAARLLLYRLASRKSRGERTGTESAMVKLVLSETFLRSGLETMQTYGAYGYMEEAGIERDIRDALASRIYSGTSDMQRNIIARGMGLT